ncbi:MAG: DUF928 domain-containing protein [Myxococcota bacterium]
MRCDRSDPVTLDAFLLDRSGDASLDAFRAHYPGCPDCATAVADWMALAAELAEAMAERGANRPAHPDPETLARFVAAPDALEPSLVARIEGHVDHCPGCANELRAIRRFDPVAFGAAIESAPAPARAGNPRGLGEVVAAIVERLRGFDLLAPVPALLSALLVLGGLWLGGVLDAPDLGAGGAARESQLAARPRPGASEGQEAEPSGLAERASSDAVDTPTAIDGAGSTALAEASPSAASSPSIERTVPRAPIDGAAPALPTGAVAPDAEASPRRAAALAHVSPSDGRPRSDGETVSAPVATSTAAAEASPAGAERPSAAAEEIRIAALVSLPPPDYAMPADAAPLAWMRSFGTVRSAATMAHVTALAPRTHAGRTRSRSPRLWWSLDRATDRSVEFTLVEGEAIDPVVRVALPGPHAAGLHVVDLAARGVELEPEVEYRWFVSLGADPDRPSRPAPSAGALRVVAPSESGFPDGAPEAAPALGRWLAERGLWYDAFDYYSTLAAAHPEVARIAADRDRLLAAVDLRD